MGKLWKMGMVRLGLGCGSLGVLRDLGWLVGWLRWFGGSKLFGEVVGFSVWPCGARFYIRVLVLHDSTSTRLAEKSNSGRKSNSKAWHRRQAAEDLPREAHVACEDGAF